MEIYFSIVLVLSAICLIWWTVKCTTKGGLLADFIFKIIPMILAFSLLFMFSKSIGWV